MGLKHRHSYKFTMVNPNFQTKSSYQKNLKTNVISICKGDIWKEICRLEKNKIKIQKEAANLHF